MTKSFTVERDNILFNFKNNWKMSQRNLENDQERRMKCVPVMNLAGKKWGEKPNTDNQSRYEKFMTQFQTWFFPTRLLFLTLSTQKINEHHKNISNTDGS